MPSADAYDFLAKVELINASMAGNANFPAPWPAPLPSPDGLSTAVATYSAAYSAAAGGGTTAIATRKAARDSLTSTLKNLALYLMMVAQGDETMLSTTGFDLSKPIVHGTSEVLPAPSGFKLTRGEISGTLVVQATRLAGAASYQLQTTEGDPTMSMGWVDGGTFAHCSKIQLSGLTVGKNYSVRLRAVGTAGPGAWTQAATLMVV